MPWQERSRKSFNDRLDAFSHCGLQLTLKPRTECLCRSVRIVTSAVDTGLEQREIPIQEVDPQTGLSKTRVKKCWAILPGGKSMHDLSSPNQVWRRMSLTCYVPALMHCSREFRQPLFRYIGVTKSGGRRPKGICSFVCM